MNRHGIEHTTTSATMPKTSVSGGRGCLSSHGNEDRHIHEARPVAQSTYHGTVVIMIKGDLRTSV